MKSTRKADEFSTGDLKELQGQLSIWRRQQAGRTQLPEAVWRSAAALALRLGVSQVCRTLHLNYYKLNRLTARATVGPPDAPLKTTFVELALGDRKDPERSHGYRAEMGDSTTDKLTFDLGGDVSAVVALAESFWRRKR